MLTQEQMIWAFVIAFVLGGSLAFLFWKQRQQAKLLQGQKLQSAGRNNAGGGGSTYTPVQMQLQAYERLILLTERIALPNLIGRLRHDGYSAREMQSLLTESIRQEFEHNITQQIYVTSEAWDAVRNLKEQNIFIVNQVSSFLPQQASALDLSKHLLEMIAQNPKASLHGVVAEVLSFEAKKLMK